MVIFVIEAIIFVVIVIALVKLAKKALRKADINAKVDEYKEVSENAAIAREHLQGKELKQTNEDTINDFLNS